MKKEDLSNMVRGWFVGDFDPSVYKTQDVEVGIKRFKAGDHEEWHYHKIATEITVIISGEVELKGQRFKENDIITINPGEGSEFKSFTDGVLMVVKIPGVKNDKYLRGE